MYKDNTNKNTANDSGVNVLGVSGIVLDQCDWVGVCVDLMCAWDILAI